MKNTYDLTENQTIKTNQTNNAQFQLNLTYETGNTAENKINNKNDIHFYKSRLIKSQLTKS